MNTTTESHNQGSAAAEKNAPEYRPAPKWMALVEDEPIPLPQRTVTVGVIRSQANVPGGVALTRDYNSPNDFVLGDDATLIDLAEGNVFYRVPECEEKSERCRPCAKTAKLAYFIDDRAELTTNPKQTGKSLRALFGFAADTSLFRDFESPHDEPIAADVRARFADGPVFYTRRAHVRGLVITVNSRQFAEADGVKASMTGEDIARLVYPKAPRETRVWQRGDAGEREIDLDESIAIKGCEVFDVARRRVDGGYALPRVERELALITAGGGRVKLIAAPINAVLYYGLRTRPRYPVEATDVLVPIPPAYPGQFLDWAYLPEGSPLIGKVAGSALGHAIQADGRTWRQISYHPHTGGGGPPWDPSVHGFHTYLTELITWLYNAR